MGFSLRTMLTVLVVLSVAAVPFMRASRSEAALNALGEATLARLMAEPPATWHAAMYGGTDAQPALRAAATHGGINHVDTGLAVIIAVGARRRESVPVTVESV